MNESMLDQSATETVSHTRAVITVVSLLMHEAIVEHMVAIYAKHYDSENYLELRGMATLLTTYAKDRFIEGDTARNEFVAEELMQQCGSVICRLAGALTGCGELDRGLKNIIDDAYEYNRQRVREEEFEGVVCRTAMSFVNRQRLRTQALAFVSDHCD